MAKLCKVSIEETKRYHFASQAVSSTGSVSISPFFANYVNGPLFLLPFFLLPDVNFPHPFFPRADLGPCKPSKHCTIRKPS